MRIYQGNKQYIELSGPLKFRSQTKQLSADRRTMLPFDRTIEILNRTFAARNCRLEGM